MQHSKVSIALALALALLCAGCGRQAAAITTPSLAAATTTDEHSTPQADPATQCKSWGIEPGTPGYKECVDGMNEAANAPGVGGPQTAEQAQADALKMRADMAQQRDAIRKQIEDQTKDAKRDPRCVTVTNGTNTSTSCP